MRIRTLLPHIGELKNIGVRETTSRSDREVLAEKAKERRRHYREQYDAKNDFYRIGGFWFDNHLLDAYEAGFDLVPAYNLSLARNNILPEHEALIRDDPEWQQFATRVVNKIAQHRANPTNTRKYGRGRKRNPDSWATLEKDRDLLVDRILLRTKRTSILKLR
jgi:hypothetical protein